MVETSAQALPGQFGGLLFRDILNRRNEVIRNAVIFPDQRNRQVRPGNLSILADVTLLDGVVVDFPVQHAFYLEEIGWQIFRTGNILDGFSQKLCFIISEHPA